MNALYVFYVALAITAVGIFTFVFRSMNAKLELIHMLVNSNLTASMQAELDATIRELAMMHEVIDLKRANGRDPLPVVLETLAFTEGKIAELKAKLHDRLTAQAGH
jgi:hypothetical protein